MEQKEQNTSPSVQIITQYIKDLSFEAPNLPLVLSNMKNVPEITVDIDVQINKTDKEHLFNVDLHIKANAQRADDKRQIYICELLYGALTAVQVPQEQLEPVLIVEIPHLLFPYARAIIANITGEIGLPPLQINPIDFMALYKKKNEKSN